ncbi:hypothetical protein BDV09DRAFT_119825 [Aspergillus tetrazonus]
MSCSETGPFFHSPLQNFLLLLITVLQLVFSLLVTPYFRKLALGTVTKAGSVRSFCFSLFSVYLATYLEILKNCTCISSTVPKFISYTHPYNTAAHVHTHPSYTQIYTCAISDIHSI